MTQTTPPVRWEIIDVQTGARVGKPYNCKKRCRTRADKLDLEYGAYRYRAQPIGGYQMLARPRGFQPGDPINFSVSP